MSRSDTGPDSGRPSTSLPGRASRAVAPRTDRPALGNPGHPTGSQFGHRAVDPATTGGGATGFGTGPGPGRAPSTYSQFASAAGASGGYGASAGYGQAAQFATDGPLATASAMAGPSAGPSAGSPTAASGAPSTLGGPGGGPGGVNGSPGLATLASPAPRKLSGRRRRETVAVLIFSGAPIFESSIPLSVFGVDRQDAGVPRYRLLVCAGEDGPLTTTGGLTLTAPYGLEALSRAGTIVVPAWRSISQPPPAEAITALRKAHHEGARIIGLCTGAFVLAAAGLLDGRPATTHWMYAPTLAKRYPRVHVDPRELFVDDGDVLTSAGTAAGIDLCLHVVRSDHGAEAANALARRLVVPNRRSGGGQAQYIDQSLPEEIGNDPLAEVVTWALENLNQQFDVEVLAARAYMSRRTFDRRFRTLTGSAPLQWLITQRVLQAQRLLETSDLSVDDVARRCGFRSPVALRGHFRRQLGVSPAAYRTTYRARRPAPAGGVPPQALPGERPVPSLSAPGPAGLTGGPGPGAGAGGPASVQPYAGASAAAYASAYPAVQPSGHQGAHPGGQSGGYQSGAPGAAAAQAGGPPPGGRTRIRPLVPPQPGPVAPRAPRVPERPGGRAGAGADGPADGRTGPRAGLRDGVRDGSRGEDRTVVEHAVADEHGHDQPSARGQGLGHRPDGAARLTSPHPDESATAGPGPDAPPHPDGESAHGGEAQHPRTARPLSASRDRAVG